MDEYPSCSFGFDDHVSDNELLELADNIPHHMEDKTAEKAKTNERFANLTTEELDALVEKSQSFSTKTNTKWAVKLFEGMFYTKKKPVFFLSNKQTNGLLCL
jgi:hypothetical protein